MGTIAIRADANEKIAMGHIMRCMSIAFQLKKSGHNVIFILAEHYAEHLIVQNGFSCICMEHTYAQMEQELDELSKILIRLLRYYLYVYAAAAQHLQNRIYR